MFRKIMIPVDLAHVDKLERALGVAASLAREYGAEMCYVGVTTALPTALAANPQQFDALLADFTAAQSRATGLAASHKVIVSNDPSTQMDAELEACAREIGADLVVMATHMPDVTDYIWAGHGSHMATHAECSVLLVR